MKKDMLTRAIIKTLCYAQTFSYPLTISELFKYLISSKKIAREELLLALYNNQHLFEQKDEYVVLRGDAKLIRERSKRKTYSRKKLAKALWISQVLSYIPTVKLIGLSGSLSMYNAKREDDIDLFFITSRNSLWITRALVNIILLFIGEKRGRNEKLATDKICTNMFLSEEALKIEKKQRNLYTAHEVAQLKVLFSRDYIYQEFLKENKWVLRFLPHAFEIYKKSFKNNRQIIPLVLLPLEYLIYQIQLLYMKRRITNEVVKRRVAMFHPLKRDNAILVIHKLKVKHQARLLKTAVIRGGKTTFNLAN